ncbi:hypothetical protein SAMN04487993_104027 [Salipiger marinus]|jgi:hypothetical protein|uniref:Uncharacterized protein n=2 Tax=Salipiger marinus TaxID=555512 RepID=A0A1G8UFI1_9RHOB|nr:hypothetical protein SAMN04487993_104027 [Salipiger marinus]
MTGPEDIDLHAEIAMALVSIPADQQTEAMRALFEATGGLWLVPEEAPATPYYHELIVGGIRVTGSTMTECVGNYLAQTAGKGSRTAATTHETAVPTLREARATLADAAHHAPGDVLTACVVIEDQTDEPAEAAQARDLRAVLECQP